MYNRKIIRPFSSSATIKSKSYSMPLQRAIVDFAADVSFEKASYKLKEHYHIDLPKSSIRNITLHHAQNIEQQKREIQKFENKKPIVDYVIAEADGTMVPIVVIDKEAVDKRKAKTLLWREARLSLAYKKGEVQPVYDASFGRVDEVGEQIAYCVKSAGQTKHSKIHFVGDGAPWIADQVEKLFGSDASYLIDYYHMTEYLAEASQCCSPSNKKSWRKAMQLLMKEGKLGTVLKELESHLSNENDHTCHARKCYKYLVNRLNQFNYKGALEKELPIGSGRVEGGHRNVIQQRLKAPGAWWREKNASAMLALRVIRENSFWKNYWVSYSRKNSRF